MKILKKVIPVIFVVVCLVCLLLPLTASAISQESININNAVNRIDTLNDYDLLYSGGYTYRLNDVAYFNYEYACESWDQDVVLQKGYFELSTGERGNGEFCWSFDNKCFYLVIKSADNPNWKWCLKYDADRYWKYRIVYESDVSDWTEALEYSYTIDGIEYRGVWFNLFNDDPWSSVDMHYTNGEPCYIARDWNEAGYNAVIEVTELYRQSELLYEEYEKGLKAGSYVADELLIEQYDKGYNAAKDEFGVSTGGNFLTVFISDTYNGLKEAVKPVLDFELPFIQIAVSQIIAFICSIIVVLLIIRIVGKVIGK